MDNPKSEPEGKQPKKAVTTKRIFATLFRSLGTKLIVALSLVLILFMGLFAFVMVKVQREQLIGEVVRSADRFSDTIKKSTRNYMLEGDSSKIYKVIEDVGRQEDIDRIRIFNNDGMIMFSTHFDEKGKLVDKKAEACYVCHGAEELLKQLDMPQRSRIFNSSSGYRVLGIINPIYNDEECYTRCHEVHPREQKVLGVLDIDISLARVDTEIATNRWHIVVFSIVAIILIAFIVALFVRKFVHNPVQELVLGTQRIAQGDLEHEIIIHSRDEIGKLARAFNWMTKGLKETQFQLFQKEKLAALGMLAAQVAHEINNPLTTVLTNTCLLLEKAEGSDPRREDYQEIVTETERCRDIVKGLLDFARQSRGEKSPVNLNKVLTKSISLLENQAAFRDIQIKRDFQDTLPLIMADANQLQQVFMNMLLNSAEAMPDGGEISVVSARINGENKSIAVSLRDSGYGIPADKIQSIFEPFFTTKGRQGSGLGLAVCYGIISRHGGTIDVESEVGKGTVFTIKLPIGEEK
ncbi:MAG: HAMP domain-containing protein [Deltaproteobacteria bacterium]|nr:MAG: HAMP domain-containing protein [Deltaproteobacteria bacterium]